MKGFAWCENAGWISFDPTGSIDSTSNATNSNPSDTFFTKSTGLFHGFAWSENLGWISMEGLMTDITPPSALNFQAFAASGSKVFTLADPSPIAQGVGLYEFKISDWNDDVTQYGTITGSVSPSFTHDFRQAKLYSLKITDPFGNSSE